MGRRRSRVIVLVTGCQAAGHRQPGLLTWLPEPPRELCRELGSMFAAGSDEVYDKVHEVVLQTPDPPKTRTPVLRR